MSFLLSLDLGSNLVESLVHLELVLLGCSASFLITVFFLVLGDGGKVSISLRLVLAHRNPGVFAPKRESSNIHKRGI